jgi:hypothetical protein
MPHTADVAGSIPASPTQKIRRLRRLSSGNCGRGSSCKNTIRAGDTHNENALDISRVFVFGMGAVETEATETRTYIARRLAEALAMTI